MKAVLQKIFNVMESIDSIGKDKRNTNQNYDYASEHAIKLAVRKELIAQKLILKLETSNYRIVEGKTVLDVNYHFIDIETAEELTGTFQATGQGRDDKGNWAAVTGAIKYICTTTFFIPTGDDPENPDNETKKPNTPKAPAPPIPPPAPPKAPPIRTPKQELMALLDTMEIPKTNQKGWLEEQYPDELKSENFTLIIQKINETAT